MLLLESLPGCPQRVDLVGLGAPLAGRLVRPVHLAHPLAGFQQIAGQPGPKATGAFHRPNSAPRLQSPGPLQQLTVAAAIADDRDQPTLAPQRVQQRRRVLLLGSVDPDHRLDPTCQHGHGCLPPEGAAEPGAGLGAAPREAIL